MNKLFNKVAKELHPVNPRVMEGYAKQELSNSTEFLFQRITRIIKEHNITELELISIKPVEPRNQFPILANRTKVCLAKSSLLSHAFKFKFKHTFFSYHISLPIFDGKRVYINDTAYTVKTTIRDMVLSVNNDNIMISLDKRTIKTAGEHTNFKMTTLENGEEFRFFSIVHSLTLFKESKGIMKIPLLLYRILKVGYKAVVPPFKILIGGFNPQSGFTYISLANSSITLEYPTPTENSDVIHHRMSQISYMLSMLGTMHIDEVIELTESPNISLEEEKYIWYTIMSLLVVNAKKPASYCYTEIIEHVDKSIESLNEPHNLERLADIGVKTSHVTELFMAVSDNFMNWLHIPLPNMKRELTVLDIVYQPILHGFVRLMAILSNYDWSTLTITSLNYQFRANVKASVMLSMNNNKAAVDIEQLNNPSPLNNLTLSTEHMSNPDKSGDVLPLIPTPKDIFLGNVNVLPGGIPWILSSLNPYVNIVNGVVDISQEDIDIMTEYLKT